MIAMLLLAFQLPAIIAHVSVCDDCSASASEVCSNCPQSWAIATYLSRGEIPPIPEGATIVYSRRPFVYSSAGNGGSGPPAARELCSPDAH